MDIGQAINPCYSEVNNNCKNAINVKISSVEWVNTGKEGVGV